MSNKQLRGPELDTFIENLINEFIEEVKPRIDAYIYNGEMNNKKLGVDLYRDINEYGPISNVLKTGANDVVCNGPGPGNLRMYKGMKSVPLTDENGKILFFKTADEIEAVCNKLGYFDNKRLTSTNQVIRAITPQGYRLTATHRSASSPILGIDGIKRLYPTFSIRMSTDEGIPISEMIYKYHSIHPDVAKMTVALAKLDQAKVLFSGPPGTGKTTFMMEIFKELLKSGKIGALIEATPERQVQQYTDNGLAEFDVKVWHATGSDEDAKNLESATMTNFYYAALSTKLDIIAITEVRTVDEINLMLKTSISGQNFYTTLHGESEEATLERAIKDIMGAKRCSRAEAIEEAYLSVNLIVGMQFCKIDGVIRIGYVSEITKTEDANGNSHIRPNRLIEFVIDRKSINPDTKRVYGHYRKIGMLSPRLQDSANRTILHDDEEQLLALKASVIKPHDFSEDW